MKKYLLIIGFLATMTSLFSQANESIDIVKVKVVCTGNSEAAAITEGLRSALSQTSGVFISANTTVINDQITNDQITMINNGSIAEYKIIEKFESDDRYTLTLEVGVSVNKLGSFVKSSGGQTELQGGLFAENIKLNQLNEKSEKQSINDLIEISNSLIRNCFDYNIINGEPTNVDGNWSVPLRIDIKKNQNWDKFVKFFYSTLKQIGMGLNDIEKYSKLNLPLYTVGLFDNSSLTYSTPTILFKNQNDKLDFLKAIQKKEYNYSYYYVKNVVNSGIQSGFLTSDLKEAMSFQSKYVSMDDYGRRRSEIQPYFLTSNPSGMLNMIVLRKKESFELVMNFVTHLHQQIRDVEIDNGISRLNLKLTNNYSNYSENKNYTSLRDMSCFPISLLPNINNFFTGTYRDIENSNNGGRAIEYLDVDLESWMNYRRWRVTPQILRNKSWENKMIEQRKEGGGMNSNGYTCGLFTDSLTNNDAGLNGTEGRNYSKSYFDYVFGNFALYQLEIQKLRNNYSGGNGYSMIRHFPLQLTLIGNDNNTVFIIAANNILNTTDIANVKKYTVEKTGK